MVSAIHIEKANALCQGEYAVASGREILKRRLLALEQELVGEDREVAIKAVRQMLGIHRVEVSGRKMPVEYDLKQITAEQIEACLLAVGVELAGRWADRLKCGWIRNTEKTELDNLNAPDGACRNRAPTKESTLSRRIA